MEKYSSNQFERRNVERELKRERISALAKELSENLDDFPFSGITQEAYSRIKAVEELFPDYTTPIDTLIERLKNEGMKVVLGKDPTSGNAYILPAQSNDIQKDAIFPKYLQISETMDERLKKLILRTRDWEKMYGVTRK